MGIPIVLDFDDVIVDTGSSYKNFLDSKYPGKCDGVFLGKTVGEMYGFSREQALAEFKLFEKTPFYKNIKPIEGMVEGVRKISSRYDLVIGTARTEESIAHAFRMFNQYAPDVPLNLYGGLTDKVVFAESIGAFAVVDDQFRNIKKDSKSVKRILFSRNWNVNVDCKKEGVKRAQDWKNLLEILYLS
jgi:hypothetical protein